MGLFSSKKKTVVGTVTSRVIADTSLPNAVRTGTLKAIIGSQADLDTSIPNMVMEELSNSMGVRAERYFNYGRDHYTYGLPSGQFLSATQGRDQVQAILDAAEGSTVAIEYCNFGPPNDLHIAWMKLISEQGYDPATNQLSVLSAVKGAPVYLDDLVVTIPASQVDAFQPGALDQWGTSARAGSTPERKALSGVVAAMRSITPVSVDATALSLYVNMEYVWVGTDPVTSDPAVLHGNLPITVDDFDQAADYFHVKYSVGGATKYWIYKWGAGTYPTLDSVFATESTTSGTYFPFLYFRFNKTNDAADKTTAAYTASKTMAKRLGLDFDSMADAIDQNPDIADVQQAMMIMAVPATTTNELDRRYLFEFFDNMYLNRGTQYKSPAQAHIDIVQNLANDPNTLLHSTVIQDQRFKMTLSDAGIFKKRVGGTIGAIGTHDSGVTTETNSFDYLDGDGIKQTTTYTVKFHYYRKQVAVGLYDEILVAELQMLYFVIDGYFTTADDVDDILLIPVDRSITHNYTIPEREQLYARSLHYVFNSVQIIKIKWYQTGIFQVIVAVVALVIAYYTGQFELVGAALAGSTAAAITLIVDLVTGVIIGEAFKLFAKVVGGDVALILAVAAAIYGGYQALQAGSLAGAPFAQQLLQLSSGLAKGVSSYYAEELKNLSKNYTTEQEFEDKSTKELEKAQKLLENDNYLSPIVIFGENPNEFYNRTIHSGNIGMTSIGAISSYVDTALRLPSVDATLGDHAYG